MVNRLGLWEVMEIGIIIVVVVVVSTRAKMVLGTEPSRMRNGTCKQQ
jgi:hypothetical protein